MNGKTLAQVYRNNVLVGKVKRHTRTYNGYAFLAEWDAPENVPSVETAQTLHELESKMPEYKFVET